MADFNPSDAAFEGFRITREHPAVMPVWAVLQFVVSTALIWALVSSGFQAAMMDLQQAGGQPDLEALGPTSTAFVRKFALLLPLSILVNTLIQAAVMRMVLRPSERSFGYLRFGGDELRIAAVQVITGLIIGGFSFFGLVIISAIIGIGGVFGALVSFPLMLGYVAAIIFLSVRLSLAIPATFVRGRIDIRGAWELTRGKFWPICTVFLLAFVLYLVVLLAGSMIGSAIGFVFGGANPPEGAATFADYLSPGQIVGNLVGSVIAAMGSAILYAPGAVIYRKLASQTAPNVF